MSIWAKDLKKKDFQGGIKQVNTNIKMFINCKRNVKTL